MTHMLRDVLLRQLGTAWRLTTYHLDTLTTDECLWQPSPGGLHVRADGQGWRADWPDRESYDIGAPSIAWTTWHIGYWWSTVLDQSFGDARLTRDEIRWPGTADGVREWLHGLHDDWHARLRAMDDPALMSTEHTRWPMKDRPFADVVAWANVELAKNAAELGQLRFLHATRGRTT